MVDKLKEQLKVVESIAAASKFKRMMINPFKYFNAIFFREVIYKRRKVEKDVVCKTFFGTDMHLLLPSSTDIYLTGGKSHDSEVRLAKFLINNLKNGDTLLDVGAHYGYFSLLGALLVGDKGKVFCFEASPKTFSILNKNISNKANINGHNLAVSNESTELKFYEFPTLYSEYNTMEIEQFKDQAWFKQYKPKEIIVKSVILDDFLAKQAAFPKIIKIDVEGAEYKVIKGLIKYLNDNTPYLVMEYLSEDRSNKEHVEAEQKLNTLGYLPHSIDQHGNLQKLSSIAAHLKENNVDSDNIVFVKK